MRGLRRASSPAMSESYSCGDRREVFIKQRISKVSFTMRLHSHHYVSTAPYGTRATVRHPCPHMQNVQHAEATPSPLDTHRSEVVNSEPAGQLTSRRVSLSIAGNSMHLTQRSA